MPAAATHASRTVVCEPDTGARRVWPALWFEGSRAGVGRELLSLPFDAVRFQYATAVRSGMVRRSSLASGQLERNLDILETLMLGPMARRR